MTISLPIDVLELIMDEVEALSRPDPNFDCGENLEEWHGTLEAFSRVNSAILPIARKRLFRRIIIRPDSSLTTTGCFHIRKMPSTRSRFLTFLRSLPQTRRYIEELQVLDIVPMSHPSGIFRRKQCCFDDDALLSEVFSLLPHLKSLHLIPMRPIESGTLTSRGLYRWDYFPVSFLSAVDELLCRPSFTSLTLDSFINLPLRTLLSKATPSFSNLTLRGVMVACGHSDERIAFRLRSLTLTDPSWGTMRPWRTVETFVPHLPAFDLSCLKELCVGDTRAEASELMSTFDRCATSVERLTFHLPPNVKEERELHLRDMPRLHSLVIDCSSLDKTSPFQELARLLHTADPTQALQNLSLTVRVCSVVKSTSKLVDGFRTVDEILSEFESLRRVEIRFVMELSRGKDLEE